jgi:hypothetical protein
VNWETLKVLIVTYINLLLSGIALGYGLDDWGFESRVQTDLGSHRPSYTWVPGALSLGAKRPGHEGDHSHPSSDEVKNVWSYISDPPMRLHGVVLS